MPDFTVVQSQQYPERLLLLIPSAKKRIVITAMIVRFSARLDEIERALIAAIKRGVRVQIVADNFGQSGYSRGGGTPKNVFKAECQRTLQLFERLRSANADISLIGKIGLNPYAGRYHAKITIVDNHVFSFGGINFSDDSFEHTDYMLYAHEAALADQLAHIAQQNAVELPNEDLSISLDAKNTLLFDAGVPGKSIIYEQACELAANAQSIIYISQMQPSGELGHLIRNTRNTCYICRPIQGGIRLASLAQLWDSWHTKLVNQYKGSRYLHAKCILFEQKDGSKMLISGSHNFSWRGVAFGSKEIALRSSDPLLWSRLQEWYAHSLLSPTKQIAKE